MNLYFIGKYRDRVESREPELMQKIQHDLSLDSAKVLTAQYNERLGHTVKDGELLRRDQVSPYFMFNYEPYDIGTKCWNENCGHARGEHDEAGCRGGEDTICRCASFVEPDDDLPSLENGDWHDGPHEYEDGYDDDGQGIVCVKCAAAKREAKNVR